MNLANKKSRVIVDKGQVVKISKDKEITLYARGNEDYICITDIAKVKNESGLNGFVLTVKQWIEKTRAIAIEQMKLLVVGIK